MACCGWCRKWRDETGRSHTSTWLSVDHIAIWMQVEPGEIGRVVTRPGELLDGHEPIFPRELSIWKRDMTPRGAPGSAPYR